MSIEYSVSEDYLKEVDINEYNFSESELDNLIHPQSNLIDNIWFMSKISGCISVPFLTMLYIHNNSTSRSIFSLKDILSISSNIIPGCIVGITSGVLLGTFKYLYESIYSSKISFKSYGYHYTHNNDNDKKKLYF